MRVDRHADWAAERLVLVLAQKPGQHVDRIAGRLPTLERHEDDLVATVRLAVPGAVLADEGALLKRRRQAVALGEDEAKRCGVRAERVVRHDRLLDQVRALRLHPVIHMIAVVAVGPAVEAAVLDRGQVVGHEIAAELVAFVDDRPQHAGLGLPRHAVGVAQAGGEHAMAAGRGIDLPDRGAAALGGHAVLGDIAVRANRRVQQASRPGWRSDSWSSGD